MKRFLSSLTLRQAIAVGFCLGGIAYFGMRVVQLLPKAFG